MNNAFGCHSELFPKTFLAVKGLSLTFHEDPHYEPNVYVWIDFIVSVVKENILKICSIYWLFLCIRIKILRLNFEI